MAVRAKYDIDPILVKPKLSGLDVTNITEADNTPKSTVGQKSNIQSASNKIDLSDQQKASQGYAWNSWSLSLGLSNMDGATKAITKFLKQVNQLAKIITQILKIIQLLSGNVKSIAMFINFLIKIIAEQLKNLINSFASTGLYISVIAPPFNKNKPKYTIPMNGGYREFIQRVNSSCTSSTDPDRPQFDSPQDKVGGVILAMVGGINDPQFLVDLVHNFKILSLFFGFQSPMPTPPNGFKVTSGFYKNPQTAKKAMGVQLTWSAPDTPVTGYKIYKATNPQGFMKSPNPTQDGVEISVRVAGEWIADVPNVFGKVLYRYMDFAVEDNKKYYYKVYSIIGDDFFDDNPIMEDIKSPVATKMLSAQPRNRIPLSELTLYTSLGINGELLDPDDFGSEWQSISVRGLLGDALDGIFKKIDALADKLTGLVNTGSNSTSEYIKFYAKRVETLLETVTKFSEIITRLLAFNLRGTFMCLRLPIMEGGMPNFVKRFNDASSLGNTKSGTDQSETLESALKDDQGKAENNPFKVTQGGGIAQYAEQGIMFGVILLFGFPNPDPKALAQRLLVEVGPNDVQAQIAKLKSTEVAITTMLKLFGLE
jgi:hypothetical protein